ncbi:hypothetical protein PISL3812_05994 [Talaromyces islandicus]|uniref:Mitotic checkpoint regulator, MAD2B-interacting-domain-containing protein n=1 Tax=Talaromyces islandicus TaxID=28573 RepID=A0A0U1M089_TALIS|nr:hypothetical protein PISL3812_05994 [Talaromyces islandicus]
MALVQYSDSEGSDAEDQQPKPAPVSVSKEPAATETKPSPKFSSLVDRANPRKIRVALPEIKAENEGDAGGDEDGPARKKPKTGAGGGLFSGFNSILPAPKRANQPATTTTTSKTGAPRKVFSLKTGAAPGFDRQADAELRQEQALNEVADNDKDIPKPGSLAGGSTGEGSLLKEANYKKQGNAMAFKPLSVARNGPKKKSAAFVAAKAAAKNAGISKPTDTTTLKSPASEKKASEPATSATPTAVPPPKPKVSLFSFSSEEKDTPSEPTSGYESILYKPPGHDDASALQEDSASLEYHHDQQPASYPTPSTQQNSSLDSIADDLNLSRAQRRQLMGRNPGVSLANSRIVNFNTDTEYAANQEMLSKTTEEELASQQHNPVRAIAPGKHSLRQLVQAANSQKDALEDSFAAGRRNKKEAGSRYGW